MAILFKQSTNTASSSATSLPLAYGSNVTGSSLLIVAVRIGALGRTVTVSDNVNAGNYTQAVTQVSGGSDHQSYIFYLPNGAAGATTVTVGISGVATTMRFAIHEYTGTDLSTPLDQKTSAPFTSQAVGTAPSSGSVTTLVANELLFGLATDANAASTTWTGTTSPSTWNAREHVLATSWCLFTDDLIVSSTGTYANAPVVAGATSTNGSSLIATFSQASAVSAATDPAFYLKRPTFAPNNLKTIITDY